MPKAAGLLMERLRTDDAQARELRQTGETTLELAPDGQRWPQTAARADLLNFLDGL